MNLLCLAHSVLANPPGFRGSPVLGSFNYQSFAISLDFYPLPESAPKPKQSLNKFEKILDDLTKGRYRGRLARGDWGRHNILTGANSTDGLASIVPTTGRILP